MEEEQEIENTLSTKEKKVLKHLEKTIKLVGKLSNNNMKLKKDKKQEKRKNEQREKE